MRLLFLFLLLPLFLTAQLPCKINVFWDGDSGTAYVQKDSVVSLVNFRLVAIDAPEKKNPYNKFEGQYFAQESRAAMQKEFDNKTGVFYPLYEDPYGRVVCRIVINGFDLSHYSVQNGYAWHRKDISLGVEENTTLQYEHKLARALKKGLWAYPTISPWTFRKRHQL